MDINENLFECGRICHVNRRWQLQCRGKQLRRVLKKRPNWALKDRTIRDLG